MASFFKKHPNYVVGFFCWLFAIGTIIMFPNILPKINFLKKGCVSCAGLSRFLDTLTPEQKTDLQMLDAGIIDVEGKYYLVGKNSDAEYDLYNKELIEYQILEPIIDEQLRRLITWNSLLKTLTPETYNLFLTKKATIIFRDNQYVMVGSRHKSEKGNKF